MAHIIVVGNEKGGAGKSTVTMHLATALSRMGHRVAGLDLDLRQQTFARYCLNRKKYQDEAGLSFPSPHHFSLPEIENPPYPKMKTSMITDCQLRSLRWSPAAILS